ncbi:MAG: sulfite exporter TauE/SafE family protein [Cyanobacteria bacterium P01_F01_bin.42]
MTGIQLGLMAISGIFTGILAGFLGIGGGTVLVPLLVLWGYSPLQAVATSSLAIAITACSGTLQNWRMGVLKPRNILLMGIPALVMAQVGVAIASSVPQRWLLIGLGCLMLVNIYLFQLRKRLSARQRSESIGGQRLAARGGTGGLAGLMAGLFGIGGGAIMVPLQLLLLNEPIKRAIQTSLGVIVITAIAATIGHALRDNVVFAGGIALGLGGLVGAQISTRFLPKLPDRWIAIAFRGLLLILACYSFWRALQTS